MSAPEAARQARRPTDPEVIDRLTRLRTILPLMATDLAVARRRAHALELDNRRLTRRIAELESTLGRPANPVRRAPDAEPSSPVMVGLHAPQR